MPLSEPALVPVAAHQRVDGRARIEFSAGGGRTRLADLYQRAPCRALFPDVDAGEPVQAVLLTTSGGLTGGDRLQAEFAVGAQARATLTTQAAEKIYRALVDAEPARIDAQVAVGAGGYAEYLAQETILFDGARLRRRFDADLAPGARLLALESLVFGRAAMGERYAHGFVHDAWRIRRGGRLIFADALHLDGLHLDGDIAAVRAAPFGFGDATACATLIYAADDAPALLEPVRARLTANEADAIAHATTRECLLIVRLLAADAAHLRRTVIHAAETVRSLAMGFPPRLPQVWYC
ncbi:MAG: urease accessory protein UreD [Rudaea sp.]|uniref:urease accessory protein UreD n=1 Tax=Rudaea sp. TaxID=2136325 RepID=UPI0039E629C0